MHRVGGAYCLSAGRGNRGKPFRRLPARLPVLGCSLEAYKAALRLGDRDQRVGEALAAIADQAGLRPVVGEHVPQPRVVVWVVEWVIANPRKRPEVGHGDAFDLERCADQFASPARAGAPPLTVEAFRPCAKASGLCSPNREIVAKTA